MAATIKDIAKLAGVPISAVSYALNDSGPVSEERRKKILSIAEELEYVPSGIAKSMKMQKKGFVGYFSYSLAGPVFSMVLQGIEDSFRARELELVACSVTPEKMSITRLLTEKMVDGAIIFAEYLDDALIHKLAAADFPIVLLDRDIHEEHISCILIDNINSAFQVGKLMKEKGLERVAYIDGSGFDGEQRREGFLKAVDKFRLKLCTDWVFDGLWLEGPSYEKTLNLLKTGSKPPQAVFAFNDEMAMGCMRALTEMGYRVPEDTAVIGMDDIAVGAYTTPKLTTIKRPMYELGTQAVDILCKMMSGEKGSKTVLPTELIYRETFLPV